MNNMLKLTLYFALAGMAFGSLCGRPPLVEPAPWPEGDASEHVKGARLLYSEEARKDAAEFAPAIFKLNYLGGTTDKEIQIVTVNNGILEFVKPAAMYMVDFCAGMEFYSDYAMAPHLLVGQNAENLFAQLKGNGYKVQWVTEQISGKKALRVEEYIAFRWNQNGRGVMAFALSPWFPVDAATGNIEAVQAQEWAYVSFSAAAYNALQAVALYYAERHAIYVSARNGAHDYKENIQMREFPKTVDYSLPLSPAP